MRIRIRGARAIDPASGFDRRADVFVAEGRIAAIGRAPRGFAPAREIDARGMVVCPALIELGAWLREPGFEHEATIAGEARAAVARGIGTLCAMPHTDPPIDTPAVVELVHQRARAARRARVVCIGALTRDLGGEELAELKALADAGVVAVSNGWQAFASPAVLYRALQYAATWGLTVMVHPEEPSLAGDGCLHEGPVSTALGLPPVPEVAESVMVAQVLLLAEHTGARVHLCRLSAARSVELLAAARRRGLPVTADVAVHHLLLADRDMTGFDTRFRLRPPLRSPRDRDALRRGVARGHITAVCGDHQPHDEDAKAAPFPEAAPGLSAIDTLLPLVLRLVDEGLMTLPQALATVTSGPASVAGLEQGRLRPGAPADLCVFDPDAEWTLTPETMASSGRHTPFMGQTLRGRVRHTLVDGRVVYSDDG